MNRRIRRRMALANMESLQDYARRLEENREELDGLIQDLLIRVTSFFRDPQTFDALKSVAFPRLLSGRDDREPIRIWVVGCSTGEEVYSLAIALLEELGDMASNSPIKILATDVSEFALERARAGIYVDNIAMDVSPERLRRFFVNVNGKYQISKSVRDLCVFSRHNVAVDPPFANIDLISCRNLFIYFSVSMQNRVLEYFHYSLKLAGTLMLGTSETVGAQGNLFESIHHDARLYAKRPASARPLLHFSRGTAIRDEQHDGPAKLHAPAFLELQRRAESSLLARFAPPGLIIDAELRILHFRGDLGPYVSPASGQASLDAMRILRDSLAIELKKAVQQAESQKKIVRRDGLSIGDDGGVRTVGIKVIPLEEDGDLPQIFMVLLSQPTPSSGESAPPPQESPNAADENSRTRTLERELAALRHYLQSLIEENEATSEELKSANEEILSSNEELQSTNEELQTSKEEMQSANEELGTVNEELQHRNQELRKLNDDLNNLLSGLNIPILMVDRELRIRRITEPAEALFNLLPTDVGRPVTHLRPTLRLPDLATLLREVIDTVQTKELEVQDESDCWYSLRIRPYITMDNRIDGAALAAVDIDTIKRASERLKASRDSAEAIVETVWEPLVVLDEKMQINRANAAFYRIFGVEPSDAQGRSIWEIASGQWNQPKLKEVLTKIVPDNSRVRDMEIEVQQADGRLSTLLVNAHRIFWEGSRTHRVLLAMEDITDRKREMEHAQLLATEKAARAEAEAASRQKDEFLAMLAHEMRNPLAPIRNTMAILQQRFTDDAIAREALQMSDRQIHHLTRMLDDLLDVSRITRGRIALGARARARAGRRRARRRDDQGANQHS